MDRQGAAVAEEEEDVVEVAVDDSGSNLAFCESTKLKTYIGLVLNTTRVQSRFHANFQYKSGLFVRENEIEPL